MGAAIKLFFETCPVKSLKINNKYYLSFNPFFTDSETNKNVQFRRLIKVQGIKSQSSQKYYIHFVLELLPSTRGGGGRFEMFPMLTRFNSFHAGETNFKL